MTLIVTAATALAVALITGVFTILNSRKANKTALDVEDFKSAVLSDLERLRAKLAHEQIVNTTQWNAEFAAYQGLWKGLVAVRLQVANSLVKESELAVISAPDEIFSRGQVAARMEGLAKSLYAAIQHSVSVVNDNAPFYPSEIRKRANKIIDAATDIWKKQVEALFAYSKGQDLMQQSEFWATLAIAGEQAITEVDNVEELIRQRLASLKVIL